MILSTAAGWSRSLQASPRSLRVRGNVEDVLGLKRDARFEPLVVNLSAPPHARAVGPCSRSVRVERAAWAELALGEGLHRRGHVGVMRRAVGLEHPLAAGGVGRRPALVLVVAK